MTENTRASEPAARPRKDRVAALESALRDAIGLLNDLNSAYGSEVIHAQVATLLAVLDER